MMLSHMRWLTLQFIKFLASPSIKRTEFWWNFWTVLSCFSWTSIMMFERNCHGTKISLDFFTFLSTRGTDSTHCSINVHFVQSTEKEMQHHWTDVWKMPFSPISGLKVTCERFLSFIAMFGRCVIGPNIVWLHFKMHRNQHVVLLIRHSFKTVGRKTPTETMPCKYTSMFLVHMSFCDGNRTHPTHPTTHPYMEIPSAKPAPCLEVNHQQPPGAAMSVHGQQRRLEEGWTQRGGWRTNSSC